MADTRNAVQFDSLALETARQIMKILDTKNDYIQAKIQCAVNEACQLASRPAQPAGEAVADEWIEDEDRTQKPPTAHDIPDAIWEIADRIFHEQALIANDGKCVEICARALYAHPSLQPADMEKAVDAGVNALFDNINLYAAGRTDIVKAVLTAAAPFLRGADTKAIIECAREWCEAVERNSSWDGWDHHYKRMKHELLPRFASEAEGQEP